MIFLVRELTCSETGVGLYLLKKGRQEGLRIYFAGHQLGGAFRGDDG
jgi:hypothetical protein